MQIQLMSHAWTLPRNFEIVDAQGHAPGAIVFENNVYQFHDQQGAAFRYFMAPFVFVAPDEEVTILNPLH